MPAHLPSGPSAAVTLRHERPEDAAAIGDLTRAAFLHAAHTDHTEHLIVAALRDAGELSVSLVAESPEGLVGHVALSPVRIEGSSGWYGLGPLSVLPGYQRRGIGALLVQAVLAAARERGAHGCVVLGDPEYYGRFGFHAGPALRFPGVSPEYFQSLHWQGAMPAGEVRYADAFHAFAA